MFNSEVLETHLRCTIIALFIIWLYWIKEFMEYILRIVYGVDRRMMYVPIPQNTHAALPFLGQNFSYQRGELFYYVFHATISISLAILGYILGLYTPAPTSWYS